MIVQFKIYDDGENWCARGIGVDIFTHAGSMKDLTIKINDAARLHFAEMIEAGEQITVVSLT